MLSVSAIALSGMNAAQVGLQTSAHNVANLATDGFRRQRAQQSTAANGGVDVSVTQAAQPGNELEADMVGMLGAKNQFLANLAMFKADDRLKGALLDAVS